MDRARLAEVLRTARDAIIASWSAAVRRSRLGGELETPELVDNMPLMIDRLADAIGIEGDLSEAIIVPADIHTGQRLELGYDLAGLVAEYIQFRVAIIARIRREPDHSAEDLDLVTDAIDLAVRRVIERVTAARERRLRALERISSETLELADVEALLRHVVDVLIDMSPAVTTATVLLREGSGLRVRATRGLDDEVHRGFTIAIGEGFAGTIAETREPLLLKDAAHDPLVRSEVVRTSGLRALYGVPLVTGDELIGVAHIGSKEAREFSQEDLLLLRAVANRATVLIAARQRLDSMTATAAFREQFLGILGHDLRTPLNAILGSATLLLRRSGLSEQDRRAVVRISRSAERMARMIAELLDFATSRLGGTLPLQTTWLDFCDVCRDVAEELEQAHPGRTIALELPSPAPIEGDRERLAQVLTNVVGNAIKFSPADTPVEVRVRALDGEIVFSVHNQGPPIPADLLPHLFEPFRRGRTGKGAGLGLYIVQQIVIGHGGSIEVTSTAAAGTTFTVRFPRARSVA